MELIGVMPISMSLVLFDVEPMQHGFIIMSIIWLSTTLQTGGANFEAKDSETHHIHIYWFFYNIFYLQAEFWYIVQF